MLDGQILHAKILSFPHPRTKEIVTFECDLPSNFEKLLEKLIGAERIEIVSERGDVQKTDVHLYTDGFDVVYAGCGYVALHSAEGGKKLIRLPQKLEVTHVFGAESFKVCDNEISFDLSPNGTAMFEVKV